MLLKDQNRELVSFAYNILGSYQDAKDVVQEVILERLNKKEKQVENEKAYLVRSVINRSINLKKKQSKLISQYPGNWLPEPVDTQGADHSLHQKDILSYSLMILIENLDPRSRAVFILKEAFDYDHEEIASVLGISVPNSRKILSRAKKQLGDLNTGTAMSKTPSGYLEKYIDIIRNGDMKKLEALLHEDIMTTSDGGGKAVAALHPLYGKEPVLLFLSGIYRKFYKNVSIKTGEVNHQPAILFFVDDQLVTCQVFELQDEQITRIYSMRNPDKLRILEITLKDDSTRKRKMNSPQVS